MLKMKFIKDNRKFAKIKEMASNGDEKAKDFLFNFMEMSDEEANEYLSQIAIDDEGNQEDWKSIIEDLIADEYLSGKIKYGDKVQLQMTEDNKLTFKRSRSRRLIKK